MSMNREEMLKLADFLDDLATRFTGSDLSAQVVGTYVGQNRKKLFTAAAALRAAPSSPVVGREGIVHKTQVDAALAMSVLHKIMKRMRERLENQSDINAEIAAAYEDLDARLCAIIGQGWEKYRPARCNAEADALREALEKVAALDCGPLRQAHEIARAALSSFGYTNKP